MIRSLSAKCRRRRDQEIVRRRRSGCPRLEILSDLTVRLGRTENAPYVFCEYAALRIVSIDARHRHRTVEDGIYVLEPDQMRKEQDKKRRTTGVVGTLDRCDPRVSQSRGSLCAPPSHSLLSIMLLADASRRKSIHGLAAKLESSLTHKLRMGMYFHVKELC